MFCFVARRSRLIQRNNTALQGNGGSLGAVFHTQFFQHGADVEFDRDLRNTQRRSYCLIAQPFRHHAENFQFAAGKRAVLHARRQKRGDPGQRIACRRRPRGWLAAVLRALYFSGCSRGLQLAGNERPLLRRSEWKASGYELRETPAEAPALASTPLDPEGGHP
jgi:hypothetical protein